MKFKKFLSSAMVLMVLLFSITACGNGGKENVSGQDNSGTEQSDVNVSKSEVKTSTSGLVKIICPYGVGGTADIVARRYAQVAGELFPQYNFIVEQKTGGDGFVGASTFERSDPNDQQLFVLGYGNTYRHALGKKFNTEQVPYDLDNFDPLATIDDRTWILYGRPDQTLENVLQLSKDGKLKMSGGAPLSDPHLALGSLLALEGGKVTVVSYDGGAAQKQGLTNGEVDVFVGTSQAGMEDVEAGTMIPILAFSDKTFEDFKGPEGKLSVPCLAGEGIHKALDSSKDYTGSILPAGGYVAAHAKADEAFKEDIINISKEVWKTPEFSDWIKEIGLNHFELYGKEAKDFMFQAIDKAVKAYELLSGTN